MSFLLGGYRGASAIGAFGKLDRFGVWGVNLGRCLKIFWLFRLGDRSSLFGYTSSCNPVKVTRILRKALLSLETLKIILFYPHQLHHIIKFYIILYCFENSWPLRFRYLKLYCTFS